MQGVAETVQDGASVSLEPGGQFELSGAPLKDVHACQRELDTHLEQVRGSHIKTFVENSTASWIDAVSVLKFTNPCGGIDVLWVFAFCR